MFDAWRTRIDELDGELVRLLSHRAVLAAQIAGEKRARGLPLRTPEREEAVLRAVRASNPGPLSGPAMERLFRTVMEESRRAAAAVTAGEEAP